MFDYDFSCWVVKYDGRSIYNRVYTKDSLKNNDGTIVPLCWEHKHNDPSCVLGSALLEHRENGIYAYCKFYDNEYTESAKSLIRDESGVLLSPYTYKIQYDKNTIMSGVIKEVSLVPARVDPDDDYYPVMKEG